MSSKTLSLVISTGSMSDLIEPQFYKRSSYIWMPHMFEILFEIEKEVQLSKQKSIMD